MVTDLEQNTYIEHTTFIYIYYPGHVFLSFNFKTVDIKYTNNYSWNIVFFVCFFSFYLSSLMI